MSQQIDFIKPDWDAPAQIKAYTTLRHAFHGRFAEKSADLKALLQLPSTPIWIKQTHSNILIEAAPDNTDHEADASFTRHTSRVCAILTADCLPILMCNQSGTLVAAIHAGWRGLASNIIEKTFHALQEPAEHWLAWLGPAIGQTHFEVGLDVYHAFTHTHPASITAFSSLGKDKWLANLYTLAKIKLEALGVTRLFGGNYCTYSQEDLFYSYRRDKGQTGRMASVIWIDQ